MLYISLWFYIMVAVLILLYYALPLKIRWISILAANMLFYVIASEMQLHRIFTLILMSFLAWMFGFWMEADNRHKKMFLCLALMFDTVPLLVFKQLPYVMQLVAQRDMPSSWFVPIGISFYALQLIAYDVDVYMGRARAQRNYFKFLLFASFFPLVVQGPISRYEQLSHQLVDGNRFNEEKFLRGFLCILWGFFLKLCIADKAGVIVDLVFSHYQMYQGLYVLLAGFLYSIQLYTDFMACTVLAQGVAWLFGIEVMNNFARPYFATSIKDFWRRWHISLSSWLRDYIYIPLGGNRKGVFRKYINIAITFAVSGVWHGAGLKYLFWGLLHGAYQIIGDILMPIRMRARKLLHLDVSRFYYRVVSCLVTFVLAMVAWIIFRAGSLKIALTMLQSMVTVFNPWIFTDGSLFKLGLEIREFHVLWICMGILLLVSMLRERGEDVCKRINAWPLLVRWATYLGIIVFVMVFGTYGFGYDAQAFIYGGF